MRKGEEFVQPCQMLLEQRAGGCSQQQVDRKLTNIPVLFAITGSLANHCPKRIVCSIIHELLIQRIVVFIETGTEDTLYNLIRLSFFQTADCRHHCQMQLCRIGRCFGLCHDPCTAVFCIKKFAVMFYLFAHRKARYQPHFIHPDGNEVGTELLAVQFYIHEPVIIRSVKRQRIINQIIGSQVVMGEQLFHHESIASCQSNDFCIIQLNLIQLILKLPILVMPEDNAAVIIFRQRQRKPSI